jgi:large subunit ribosomal protein L5
MLRFKDLYLKEARKTLQDHFNYKNPMMIPKILKVVINMGVGEAVTDNKVLERAISDMTLIAGQKPISCIAMKSNAAFKVRAGMAIGCKVTLRKDRMYEFLERLILVALPRVREFKPFSLKNFDGRGNLSFGIPEQIVFPEIEYDKIDKIRGLDINIVTSANTDAEAKALLSAMNFPFIKQ